MSTQSTGARGGTGDLFDLSDAILRGDADIEQHHPFSPSNRLVEASDGVAFVESFANVSVFSTGDGLCLVDTGSAFAAPAIHAAVRSWSPDRMASAVYTHGHIDHVLGCAWAKDRYGLLPEVHAHDLQLLQMAPASGALFGVHCDPVPAPERFLAEGEVITLGDEHLDVLFVPGHAPGHVAFFHPKQRFLLGGDVLFPDGHGRTDLPGSDQQVMNETLKRFLAFPDETRVLPGHGDETTVGREARWIKNIP